MAATRARVMVFKNSQPTDAEGLSLDAETAGTALAIKSKDTGSAMPVATSVVRKGRRSTALRLKDIENIRAAGVFTLQEHRPLNRFTTIHFDAANVAEPVWAIGRMMKLAKDWLRTRRSDLSYIWVREAGEAKGDHVHVLWHVPPHLIRDFAKRERGWRRLIGARPMRGSFKSKPVGLSYSHGAYGIQFGLQYVDALQGILDYICKGADQHAIAALNPPRVEAGGELWGKRYGMSENINRKARLGPLK